MGMRQAVERLQRAGHLIVVDEVIDPNLDMAEVQRRAYQAGTAPILFRKVRGSPFPAVCNLFGTRRSIDIMFGDRLEAVKDAIALKADPAGFLGDQLRSGWRMPGRLARLAWTGLTSIPRRTFGRPPSMACETSLDQLPGIVSWPQDGGPFITLPQVVTRPPGARGTGAANVGMYRIQMGGNDYVPAKEVGLHYQIHRGIGIHHTAAAEAGARLPVAVWVGGHPANTVAAVMPLPEGLSELIIAGMLGGRPFGYREEGGALIAADADFCLVGSIDPQHTKPEGPFGDHLGYYSLVHPFPVMQVDRIYHRRDAIWPFTVVGRPPQEDTAFGELIHELTKPMVPAELPGVKSLHAVDAAGVHPLLLAIGSERYTPYERTTAPAEILTQAHAILGFNQCSLAKYLLILDQASCPEVAIDDIPEFFAAVLARLDLRRDLHFQTHTTMDTLDYAGGSLNRGSKLIVAAAGAPIRRLSSDLPETLALPGGSQAAVVAPGIVAVSAPPYTDTAAAAQTCESIATAFGHAPTADPHPLVVVVDDAEFVARQFDNFLWVTFTRSDPARDSYGFRAATETKSWGCAAPWVIDARLKPYMPDVLEPDPESVARVDRLCQADGPLAGLL